MTPSTGQRQRRITAHLVAKMFSELVNHEHTAKSLAAALDVAPRTIRPYILALRLMKPKFMFVLDWENTGTEEYPHWSEIYKLGNARDAPRPPKLTASQRTQRSRERKKQSETDRILNNLSKGAAR